MGTLFQSVRILSQEGLSRKKFDVLVEGEQIIEIASSITVSNHSVVQTTNGIISPGFKDAFSVAQFPGFEQKDTPKGLKSSAVSGGFTDVLVTSGSAEPIDNRSVAEHTKQLLKESHTNFYIAGTLSEGLEGKEITEMYDMFLSGVFAFSDGIRSIQNPELLKRALLYTKPFGGKVIVFSEDSSIANEGMVNESEVSASLGLKVRPALAEEIELVRNIYLAEYTDSAIHLTGISSKKGVEIIREAKERGVQVTADAHVFNLVFSDESIQSFDSKFKLLPVLRTKVDQEALWEGLKDGTLDMVVSGHNPQDIEHKAGEFDLAEFGGVSLEGFAAGINLKTKSDWKLFYDLLVERPAKFLNLKVNRIQKGEKATFTIIEEKPNTFEKSDIKSVSKVSPWESVEFHIKVLGVYTKGNWTLA